MDTYWFAVDADGHVGFFSSGENGHVPTQASDSGGLWALWDLENPSNSGQYHDLEYYAQELRFFFYRFRGWSEDEPRQPYSAVVQPDAPRYADQLTPEWLKEQQPVLFAGVSFGDTPQLQPAEFFPCDYWSDPPGEHEPTVVQPIPKTEHSLVLKGSLESSRGWPRPNLSPEQRDQEQALLRSALADPTSDRPRLVYADWLDRLGEGSRAELIRLQCRSSQLPQDDRGREQLAAAADQLIQAHVGNWLPAGFPWAHRVRWVRGLPTAARLYPDDVTEDGLAHLADLITLQSLDLRATDITDAALVHLRRLTNLQELHLSRTRVDGSGLVHLRGLERLHTLGLYACERLTDETVKHVAQLASLRSLSLAWCPQLTDASMVELTELRELHTLVLQGCRQLTEQGVALLAGLSKLQKVFLGATNLSDHGCHHLSLALPQVTIDRS